MDASAGSPAPKRGPGLVELYTPKLVTVLREGYGLRDLRTDAVAGLTVAVVALPLSMAIAIASGTTPDRGLYAAIIGGFIVSLLGGSRFQIGGPAGAFIVLVAATVAEQGVDGLILATLMAGVLLTLAGALRLGTYIKFIPYPVTVGFTAGIAVIILASQVRDLFGLSLPGGEPGPLLEKLPALATAMPGMNPAALGVALLTIAVIIGMRRLRPGWPGMLIAVALAALCATFLALPVETIASRFGGIPGGLPAPALPEMSLARLRELAPYAFAFALLGAIESLLSAVVADSMTGRRHRSNSELVAQGIANIGSALFGGICVTGTIARTATNVRAGARGPVAGIVHAAALLAFMLVAAPLAGYIPLAALAGLLVVVAWNMVEKPAIRALLRASKGDALVLAATFLFTVLHDLTAGILVGVSLGVLLFISRMAASTGVEEHAPVVPGDEADSRAGRYDPELAADPDVVVCRITGAFFFGAAASVGAVLERIGAHQRALVVDFSAVPFLDSTGANTMAGVLANAERRGVRVFVTGAVPAVRRTLKAHGLGVPRVVFRPNIETAVAEAHAA